MAEPTDDPTNRELLETIAALKEQNAQLSERVASLERRADNTHDTFMRLARQVGDLISESVIMDAQVWELMEKAFPGHKETHWQILNILHRARKADPQGEGNPE